MKSFKMDVIFTFAWILSIVLFWMNMKIGFIPLTITTFIMLRRRKE